MRRPALFLATLLLPQAAYASPQDLFGYGPRAAAMGATGATFLDDYAAVHANPAALSRARGRRLTLGYVGAAFRLRYDGAPVSAENGSAMILGVTAELPFGGALRHRLGVGVGFVLPTDVVVRARVRRPETPQFLLLPDRVQSIAVQLGLGADLGHGLRLGIGATALAGLRGAVVLRADESGQAAAGFDERVVATWAPIAGISWERGPWRVALAYRGELAARLDISVDARGLGVPVAPLNLSGVAQYDPHQLQLEGAWARGPWTVALALTGKRWSDFQRVREATVEGASPRPPLTELHDTVVVRAGVERRWDLTDRTRVTARAGAFFEPSPAPPPTASRGYLDNDRLAITAGLAMHAVVGSTRFSADLHGQLHALLPREGEGSNGRAVTYGGTVGVAGMTASVDF